jgi:uncharacterized protein DUF6635
MTEMNQKKDLDWAEIAVNRAIKKYIDSRKDKIPGFVKKHFSFPGALALNRKAIGSDLYKAPLNVIWLPPYTVLKASSALLKKVGFQRVSSRIENMPIGFTTDVQKEVTWLIFTELLEIPYFQGKRKSNKNVLLQEILDQPEISSFFATALSKIYWKSRNPEFRFALEKNLLEYSKSRTAAADLAGSLISLSAGATVFHKMTPGALSAGGALAAAIAQQTAISNFVFGPTLGSLYYGFFPASTSVALVTVSTGTILAGLAIMSSFSGIITDPIQYRLGIHGRRLNRLIDSIEKELKGMDNSGFKIRDQYIARIFDLFDLIMKAARIAL